MNGLAFGRTAALALTVALLASCADARGASLSATPETLEAVLRGAKAGDVVVLKPAHYRNIRFGDRTFDKPLIIEAAAATIEGMIIRNVNGLELRGGDFRAPQVQRKTGEMAFGHAIRLIGVKNTKVSGISVSGPGAAPGATSGPYGAGWGLIFRVSENVELRDSRFQGLRSGVTVDATTKFRVVGNTFKAQSSDGIDISASQQGLIEGNTCSDTRISAKEHPDCIQAWSRPKAPPTADIIIRKNRVEGANQGIFLGNKVRDGVDDGGFDRIIIEDNDVNVMYPNGIALMDARDSIIRNNRIRTFPGAKHWTRIRFRGDVSQCGNVVAAGAGARGVVDPPC